MEKKELTPNAYFIIDSSIYFSKAQSFGEITRSQVTRTQRDSINKELHKHIIFENKKLESMNVFNYEAWL